MTMKSEVADRLTKVSDKYINLDKTVSTMAPIFFLIGRNGERC